MGDRHQQPIDWNKETAALPLLILEMRDKPWAFDPANVNPNFSLKPEIVEAGLAATLERALRLGLIRSEEGANTYSLTTQGKGCDLPESVYGPLFFPVLRPPGELTFNTTMLPPGIAVAASGPQGTDGPEKISAFLNGFLKQNFPKALVRVMQYPTPKGVWTSFACEEPIVIGRAINITLSETGKIHSANALPGMATVFHHHGPLTVALMDKLSLNLARRESLSGGLIAPPEWGFKAVDPETN